MKVLFITALLALFAAHARACSPRPPSNYCYTWYSSGSSDAIYRDERCGSYQLCSRASGTPNWASNHRAYGNGCSDYCCHSVSSNSLQEGDEGCYRAGSNRDDRDSKCRGSNVCARYGHDGRYYGCTTRHCCSKLPATCSVSNPSYGWASKNSGIQAQETAYFYCSAGYNVSPSYFTCPSISKDRQDGTGSMLGWSLAAKIAAGSGNWRYTSGWWTNGATFTSGGDQKTSAFNNQYHNAVRIVITNSGVTRTIDWQHNWYQTLHRIFNWGETQTRVTAESNWHWVVYNSGWQRHCNRQGVNINLGNKARVGIIMNQENDCNSPDSAIGIGLGSVSAGSRCTCCANGGSCSTYNARAEIYVMTGDTHSSFQCTPKTCYLNQARMTTSFESRYNDGSTYTVECDTGYTSNYDLSTQHSTEVTCGSNGLYKESAWRLALQIKGNLPTFRYDNALWTNNDRYDSNGELKTDAFFQAADRVKVVFNYNNVDKSFEWNWGRSSSLSDVFKGSEWQTTVAAPSTWRSVMSGAGVQNYCNRQGVNVVLHSYKARLGIIMNQENNCNSPDTALGLGVVKTMSGNTANVDLAAGSHCGCCANSGSCNTKSFSMATVYVRTSGRNFNRYGSEVCRRRQCTGTASTFLDGYFASSAASARFGDNVPYECFKGFRKGGAAYCQADGKVRGQSCTMNTCSGPTTLQYQSGSCQASVAASYDFVHTVNSDTINFNIMSKANDWANSGTRTHTSSVTLNAFTEYTVDIDAVYADMGDNGEYISSVKVNGVELGKCGDNPNPPGYDTDCSAFACKRNHQVRTGSDGKITVTMSALNMAATCRCQGTSCYSYTRDQNQPSYYLAAKVMVKAAGSSSHSTCKAYCEGKGAVCSQGVSAKTGLRINCDGTIPAGNSYCYCSNPPSSYTFLGDGCCRGTAASSWTKKTSSATFAQCQALCDADSNCNSFEVNGCGANSGTDVSGCSGNCYNFYGTATGTMTAASCVTNGDQKCFRKPGSASKGQLALSVDGNTNTFTYNQAIWTNDNTLNSGNNKKTQVFFQKARSFTFEWEYGGTTRSFSWAPPVPTSLKQIFSNSAQQVKTLAPVNTWRGLITQAAWQHYCNTQGFNLQGGHGRKARVGIIYNENRAGDCSSPDAHFGIGLNDMGAGSSCGCCANGGQCNNKKSLARIYASVSLSKRQTCDYKCLTGYEKVGLRTCEVTSATGSMGGGACVASKCTSKTTIANTQRDCAQYGNMVTYNTCTDWACKPGYSKDGATRQCKTNGRLEGGRCIENPCVRNLDFRVMSYTKPSSQCNDGGSSFHGNTCSFQCAEGYTSPVNTVYCHLGNWRTPLPKCTPSSCDLSNVQIANGFYEAEEWNLAVQVDGNSNTFKYSSALWTNTETVDSGNNKKTQAFFSNAKSFRFEFVYGGATKSFTWSPNSPTSLHTLMNQGQTQVTMTSPENWRSMISGASWQKYCNRQGFNVAARSRYARVGILFNENGPNDCNSPDAHMGIGLNDMGAGSSCSCCAVNGCSNRIATARIYALNVVSGSIPDQARVPVKCVNEDWSLALDIDGANSNAFIYNSAVWTNTDLVDDGINKKTNAFFKSTEQIKIEMIYGGVTKELVWNMNQKKSLYDLFTGGEWQTKVADPTNWHGLVANAGVQNHCNRQGVNIQLGNKARLGIVMNQETNCATPDSALGIGLSSMGAGSFCGCCANKGTCSQKKARARVYVKNSGGMRKPSGTGEMLCIKGELDVPRCEKVVFKPVNRLTSDVFPLDSAQVLEGNCGDMKMNKKAGSGALGKVKLSSYGQCCNLCTNTEGCTYFTFYEDGRCTMDGGVPKLEKANGAMVSTSVGAKAQFLVVDTVPNCPRVASVRADPNTQCDAVRTACEKNANCQYVVYSYQGDTCDTYNYCPGDNSPIAWPAGPRPTQPQACATGFSPGSGCPGTCNGKTVKGLTEMECMEECLDTPMCKQFAHNWDNKACTLCESNGVPSSTTVEFYDIAGDERIVYEAPRRSTCTTVGAGFKTCTSGDSTYTQIMVDSMCMATEDEFGDMCPEGVTCPAGTAFTAVDPTSPEASCIAMCDATPGCKFATLTSKKCFLTKQCEKPMMKPGAKVFVSGGYWQQMSSAMPDDSIILDASNRNNPDSQFTSPASGKVTAAKIVYNDGLVSCRSCDFAKYRTVCDISATGATIEQVFYNGQRVKAADTITFDAVAGGDLAIKASGNGGCGSARVSLSCTSGNSAWNKLRGNTNNFIGGAFKADADVGNNEAAFKASFDRACESGDGIWSSQGSTVVLRTRNVMGMDEDCKKPSLSDGTASYWGCGSGDEKDTRLSTFIVRAKGGDQIFPSTADPRFAYGPKPALPSKPEKCVKVVDDSLANKVMTPSERHYTYELTVGREIYQKDTQSGQRYFLGKYNSESDLSKAADQEFFEGGDGCPGGIKRSSTVKFLCGQNEAVVSASEPSMCKYEFQVSTPACCQGGSDDPTMGASDSAAEQYKIAGINQLDDVLLMYGNAKVSKGEKFILQHGLSRGGYGKTEAYVYFWFNGGKYNSLGHEFFLSTTPLKTPEGKLMTKAVYSYFDESTDKHFLSTKLSDVGKNVRREGTLGYMFAEEVAGAVPVFEFENKVQKDKQYTVNVGEFLGNEDYKKTGTIGFAMINADGAEAPPCDTSEVKIDDGYMPSCPPSIEHGQTCGFTCNSGFKAETSGKISCSKGKLTLDNCIPMSCPMDFMKTINMDEQNWAETTCSEQPIMHMKSCSVTCAYGYHPTDLDGNVLPSAEGYNIKLGCAFGVRSVADTKMKTPYCGPDKCEKPDTVGKIPHGKMTCKGTDHGDVCTLKCDRSIKTHNTWKNGRYHPNSFGPLAGGKVAWQTDLKCQNGVIVPLVTPFASAAGQSCSGNNLNMAKSKHQCASKCKGNFAGDCNGNSKSYTKGSNALCVDREDCQKLCETNAACYGIEMHKTKKRCYLNTDACEGNLKSDKAYDFFYKTDEKTKAHEMCDWLHTDDSRVFCRRAEKMPLLAEANDLEQCRAECCQQKGCRAMAFDSRTRVCSLYDQVLKTGDCEPSETVITNNRGMTCPPNSCDTRDLKINRGKHDCGKGISHGETCKLTCNDGYHPEFRGSGDLNKDFKIIKFSGDGYDPGFGDADGNGARDKVDRSATMTCELGMIEQMRCIPDPCYMPVRVNQIEKLKSHNCPLRVKHGQKCSFKCKEGYHPGPVGGMGTNQKKSTRGVAHGQLRCLKGLTNMQDCIENSCNAFAAMENMEQTDCEREVFGSTSCRFLCEEGYEPSGSAQTVSSPVCEKSRCDLKRKFSDKCDPEYGATNCWDPKTGAQSKKGVQYGVLFCDRGRLEDETCVPLTDTDEDGLYDNLFNRPLTTFDGLEYDICPFDEDNDKDGDGICGDIDICPEDPDNDEDADGYCKKVDSYTISWNFDWVAPNEIGKLPRAFNGLAGFDIEGKGIKWVERKEVECFATVIDKEGTKGISCTLDYGVRKCVDFDGEVVSYPADTSDDEMDQNVRFMESNLHLCSAEAETEIPVVPLPQPSDDNSLAMDQLTSNWKLALKIDGRSNKFLHANALWEDDKLVDDGLNQKTDAFFAKSGELKLVLDYGDSSKEMVWMHEDEEFSLQELFAGDEQLIPLQTPLQWKAMIPDAGVQDNCNRQGINVQLGKKARIGIIMNQETDCNSPDSALGVGMTNLAAGSYCGCCANKGSCNTKKATAYIYVRPLERADSYLDPCNSAPGYSYCPVQDQCIKPEGVVCEPLGAAQYFPTDLAAAEGGHSVDIAVKSPSDMENKKDCDTFPDQTCTTFPATGWFRRYQKEYSKLVKEGTEENWYSDLALPDGMMASDAPGVGKATSLEFPVAASAMTFLMGGQGDENDVVIELLAKKFGDDDFAVSLMSKPELLEDDGMYHVEWDLSPLIPTNFGKSRDDYSDEEDGVDIKIRVRDESKSGSIQIDNVRFFDAVSGCVPECFTIVRGNQPSAGRLDSRSTEILSSEVDCTDYGVDEGDCFFLEDHKVPYLIEQVGMEENSGMFCLQDTIPGDFGAPLGIGMARHGLSKQFVALSYFPRCLFIDYTDWPKTYIAAENKDEYSDGMVYLYDQQNADLFCYDGKYQDKPQCAFFSAALQVFRRFDNYECKNHDLLQKEHFDPVTGQNVGSHLLFDGGELVFWLCGESALDAPIVEERKLTRREEKLSLEMFTGKPSLDTVMWVENNCVPAGINTNPKYRKFPARSPKECATFCLNNPLCTAFEYSDVKAIQLADGSSHVLKNCWTFMDKECDPSFNTDSVQESSDAEQPKDLYIFHNTNANLAPRGGVSLIQKEKKVYRKGTLEMKMRQLRPRSLPSRPPLRRLFNAFDGDDNRKLVVDEVSSYLSIITGYEMNKNDVAILVKAVDGDLSGDLKFREFRMLFKRENLPGNFKATLKAAKEAFLDFEKSEKASEGTEEESVVALQSVPATSSGFKTIAVGGIAVIAVVALVAVTKTVFKKKKTGMRIVGGASYGTDEV